MDARKQRARIENWEAVDSVERGPVLVGEVKDHPRQRDFSATRQMTSRLIRLDIDKGEAETENTIYTLGNPA